MATNLGKGTQVEGSLLGKPAMAKPLVKTVNKAVPHLKTTGMSMKKI